MKWRKRGETPEPRTCVPSARPECMGTLDLGLETLGSDPVGFQHALRMRMRARIGSLLQNAERRTGLRSARAETLPRGAFCYA